MTIITYFPPTWTSIDHNVGVPAEGNTFLVTQNTHLLTEYIERQLNIVVQMQFSKAPQHIVKWISDALEPRVTHIGVNLGVKLTKSQENSCTVQKPQVY